MDRRKRPGSTTTSGWVNGEEGFNLDPEKKSARLLFSSIGLLQPTLYIRWLWRIVLHHRAPTGGLCTIYFKINVYYFFFLLFIPLSLSLPINIFFCNTLSKTPAANSFAEKLFDHNIALIFQRVPERFFVAHRCYHNYYYYPH